MQILKKICRKSESSLSFSYENAVTNGTNLLPIKAMRRDERFLSLALKTQFLLLSSILNPAQVTSKHKHFCCPCPKWADFVYSLVLD